MTIRINETELTSAQYQALMNHTGFAVFKVVAHRYNLDFGLHSTSTLTADNDSNDFCIMKLNDGNVLKIADTAMERWTISTNTWSAVVTFTAPTDPLETAMAMTLSGTTVKVYCCTLTGIQVNTSTDNGATWSGWSAFQSESSSTGYTYGSDITGSASSVGGNGSSNALAFDNNNSNDWVATTYPGNVSATWGSAKGITSYTIRASADATKIDRAPRSWRVKAGSTIVHEVITNPWTPGEVRTFNIFSANLGVSATTNVTWTIEEITSFNGQSPVIAEIEMMETSSITAPKLTHVAASHPDRIHMIYRDDSKAICNLRVASWNGSSWDYSSSAIWYPFDIEDFQVVTMGDGTDIIICTTQLPGITSTVMKDNSPVKKVFVSGGIICFRYKNNDWSDHIEIEVIDNISNVRWREYMKASLINGVIYVTCFAGEGTESYPHQTYRCYRSIDGIHWSIGDIMPFPEDVNGYGVQLLLEGDYLYGFEKKLIYRSDATLYVGHSPESQQLDLTERVDDYSINHSRALETSLVLHNPDGFLDDHAVFNADNTLLMYHYTGMYHADAPVLLQIAITEVDKISFKEPNENERKVVVTSRDKFAWLADNTVSEQAKYQKSQLQGGDTYNDYTATAYGGLAHTATQKGSWKTVNGYLRSDDNLTESVAFSSFSTDLWNGGIMTAFRFASTNSTQYTGLCFKAIDSNNLWYAAYKFSDDKIHLYERRNGSDTEKALSAALSWSGSASLVRYLRVEMRYASIKVYVSTDTVADGFDGGRVWTEVISYNMDCTRYIYDNEYMKDVEDAPFYRGYVGIITNSAAGMKFWTTYVYDRSLPNTIETSVRWYSALASLGSPYFDPLYRPTAANWSVDAGATITVLAIDPIWDNPESLWDDGLTYWA